MLYNGTFVFKKLFVMKVKIFLLTALMALCGNALAQDMIHTFDGAPIQTKVLEISDTQVIYKTWDNLEGPDYRMSTSRIARIVFANGTEKVFAPSTLLYPDVDPYVEPYHSPYGYGYEHGYMGYGPLEYRYGHYYDRRGRLRAEQVRDYLGVSLYGSDYIKAERQLYWGASLTLVGGVMGFFFTFMSLGSKAPEWAIDSDDNSSAISVVGLVGSAACLGVGIPLWIKGDKKLNAMADDYNKRFGPQNSTTPNLSLGTTRSGGIGLALNF